MTLLQRWLVWELTAALKNRALHRGAHRRRGEPQAQEWCLKCQSTRSRAVRAAVLVGVGLTALQEGTGADLRA